MTDKPTAFVPAKVTVKAGEEVEWDNAGKAIHAVASDKALPPGAQSLSSGFIAAGGKFTHKFTVPGTYHYKCLFHANSGMVGDVEVTK